MDNLEIAAALAEVADLLELQGENAFKVRAYRNAVRTIGDLARPLGEMVARGEDLRELPGIGEDMARYITELVSTGHLQRLRALEQQLPASLVELMKLEGIGPKRARALYDRLGVRSLDDLEKALATGRVQGLRGFGARTAERLAQAVHDLRARPQRFRLADAEQVVEPLLAHMRDAPGLERIEVAGSFRRRRETVGDIDLLAICSDPGPVMERFTSYPGVVRVEAYGRSRGAVVLGCGMHVDLRVLPRRSFGAALHYFTGSKAHNIAVRRLGVERGLRISEYGVFRVPKSGGGAGRRVGGATEEDVFAAVGMDPVPPELREDRGEIAAALEHRLPALIELADIRGDLQMHTEWSDGQDTIEEMARACEARGYAYMAITDHSASATIARGLATRDLESQWREIARVRRRVPGIRILHGLEVDIRRDGTLDLADEWLERLDLIVISVHSTMGMERDVMTRRVLRALDNPGVHILAHPTGRLIGEREPIAIDTEAVLQAAARAGVAVEVNGQPDRLDLDDVLVRRARELGAHIAIDSDAHSVDTLRFVRHGVDQARRGWVEAADVINTWTLARLERWLSAQRGARTPVRAARKSRRARKAPLRARRAPATR